MRFDKPDFLAFAVALFFGLLFLVGFVLLDLWLQIFIPYSYRLIFTLSICLAGFFTTRFIIENFIYNKVKIIYKNIHELKVGTDTDEDDAVRTTDLDMVTREVSEWAEQRRNEITKLREREDFRREFIGNVSHELKTPIFNIQGYLLTLLDGGLEDPEINQRYLKRANKSVDRMISIIEDLEVISNLEANIVTLNQSNFDIVELVRETMEMLEDRAKEFHIKLKFKKEYDKPLRVQGDKEKISQVLINLVVNAIKYGKEKGYVEARFYDMHNQILIEISDDGIGIPQADIPRVFERFYRVDKSRSRQAGGTGLGLSIVKHILDAHKQGINVRSSENAGSTFSFTLKKAK